MKTSATPLSVVIPAEFIAFANNFDCNPVGLATRMLLKAARSDAEQLLLTPLVPREKVASTEELAKQGAALADAALLALASACGAKSPDPALIRRLKEAYVSLGVGGEQLRAASASR